MPGILGMEAGLKYASEELSFSLPDNCDEIRHREPVPAVDLENFRSELQKYIRHFGADLKTVGISVSDKTRLCQFPIFLPLITEAFLEYGLQKEDITFFIAYGTHPPQSEEECLRAYGEIYREYRFVHHNARDEEGLKALGSTSRGTEVKINKEILEKDLVVTFGAILHHYFAGFGGGRKLLFPGLAGYDAILHNHSLFLDFENKRLEPGCQSGQLDGNPLAMDLEEINALLPPKLEIHGILNSQKEVCEIHFGLNYEDFKKACLRYDFHFRTPGMKDYDLVVASAGGYPKDINYIQTHKAIHNAASFVKDGGTLVILAECIDGVGNKAFTDLFKLGGPEGIFREMAVAYKNNAGTALATIEKARRLSIRIVTSLDEDTCTMMGYVKTSPEEAAPACRTGRRRCGMDRECQFALSLNHEISEKIPLTGMDPPAPAGDGIPLGCPVCAHPYQ